jgi:hypothetical protein
MRTFVAIALAAVVGVLTLYAGYPPLPWRNFARIAVALFAAFIVLALALRFVGTVISN